MLKKKNPLGETGLSIPPVIFGTSALGNLYAELDDQTRLHKNGIGIINSAVFNAGFLIGGDYYNYKYIRPDSPENRRIFKWREDFFEICRKHNIEYDQESET
ncbi:MAG TPA: hypothetical protein VJ346_06705 [Bacteroidales bacterium]|nr:hypothetical protein [Bacteroidales bacterium]